MHDDRFGMMAWNGGGIWKNKQFSDATNRGDERLPCDAHVIMHLFIQYMNSLELPKKQANRQHMLQVQQQQQRQRQVSGGAGWASSFANSLSLQRCSPSTACWATVGFAAASCCKPYLN